jgi:hypothetical protein
MMYSKMGVDKERGAFIITLELCLMIFTAILFPCQIMIHYINLKPVILEISICFILILLCFITWKYHITAKKNKRICEYIHPAGRNGISAFHPFLGRSWRRISLSYPLFYANQYRFFPCNSDILSFMGYRFFGLLYAVGFGCERGFYGRVVDPRHW